MDTLAERKWKNGVFEESMIFIGESFTNIYGQFFPVSVVSNNRSIDDPLLEN